MAHRSGKIEHLHRKVTDSGNRKTAALIGEELGESGVLDHAVLNRQITEILEGLAGDPDHPLATRIEQSLDAFLHSLQINNIQDAATHVCALLSLEIDDLRRAALLSLMVRLAGKRQFDPVAAYILHNQKVFVTGRA